MAVESPGPEGARQDLIFRSSLVLQRPVLDPCLAVGFLPLPSGGLRVGQLVSMEWRIERLKDFEENEVSKHNVSQEMVHNLSSMYMSKLKPRILEHHSFPIKKIFLFCLYRCSVCYMNYTILKQSLSWTISPMFFFAFVFQQRVGSYDP